MNYLLLKLTNLGGVDFEVANGYTDRAKAVKAIHRYINRIKDNGLADYVDVCLYETSNDLPFKGRLVCELSSKDVLHKIFVIVRDSKPVATYFERFN
jgi:hypothetical protein